MKTCNLLLVIVTLSQSVYAQGFLNLNFEQATIVHVSPVDVVASNAIPYWIAFYGKTNDPTSVGSLSSIGYNGISLGGHIVSLEDTNAIYGPLPIQGVYSVLLQGSEPGAGGTASIGQNGTIPASAHSLRFWGQLGGLFQSSFNGQNFTFSAIGSGPNYTLYGADISAFAGQTGQLLFTAGVNSSALLDNFQFSNIPIPEPSPLALLAGGGAWLAGRRWKRSSA